MQVQSTQHDVLTYYAHWLDYRRWYLRVPGLQAAVWHADGIHLSVALGLASTDPARQMSDTDVFRVASHSKTFTATAVLQLVECKLLRLDDTAGGWVPYLAGGPLASVTVRELLSHSSGLFRDGSNNDCWDALGSFPTLVELQAVLTHAEAPTLHRNERFKYSNVGFALLGLIVAAASAVPFNDYVRDHIIADLGLAHTGPELDRSDQRPRVTGYGSLSSSQLRTAVEPLDTDAFSPAAGVFSTATDLVTYFSAQFIGSGRLLTDESKRLMQQPSGLPQTDGGQYGLGMGNYRVGGRTVRGHGGGFPGQITSSLFDDEAGIAVSVLTNTIDAPAFSLSSGLFRLTDLRETTASAPPVANFLDGPGRFANQWGVTDVVPLGNSIFLLDPTESNPAECAIRLEPTDRATEMRIVEDGGSSKIGELVQFNLDSTGQTASIVIAGSQSFRLRHAASTPGTSAPSIESSPPPNSQP
ncbi:serine hydrolase domain-containing protein [Cryobacterium aureum]|uniref:serine hydrolase domain-containing protein n=1 Tax=Cryobacterium aureum TaxID=995037 RepID=UPI000CF3D4F9|nr:serine hydrolase domain-containing protein [Cryobacterium aureum]